MANGSASLVPMLLPVFQYILMLHAALVFLRATLKKWEEPGDEATEVHGQFVIFYIIKADRCMTGWNFTKLKSFLSLHRWT